MLNRVTGEPDIWRGPYSGGPIAEWRGPYSGGPPEIVNLPCYTGIDEMEKDTGIKLPYIVPKFSNYPTATGGLINLEDITGYFVEDPYYVEQTSYWPRGWTPTGMMLDRKEFEFTGVMPTINFLGSKDRNEPSLENIYLGLGITGAAQYE